MIREYGFATFENVIDESYDEELDPRRRFDKAYSEFDRLCRLDERALLEMQETIKDRLNFNALLGLGSMPAEIRRTRDIALIDTILGLTGLAAPDVIARQREVGDVGSPHRLIT